MLDYVFDAMDRRDRGMAAHYFFLYSAVRGLHAQSVFEFGAGMSTRVILDALADTGGKLISVSTDEDYVVLECAFPKPYSRPPHTRWLHETGLSRDVLRDREIPPRDLVLHDGAHDYETVRADLAAVLPHVKRGGLGLIHDSAHSHGGNDVDRAVTSAESGVNHAVERIELPYGYGLTILRRIGGPDVVRVNAFDKPSSPHHTKAP